MKRSLNMPDNQETNDRASFEVDGKMYAVRVPTVDEIQKANEIRATTFNESLSRGDLLRDQLEGELRKRKLWNDDREQEYQTLRAEVINGEYKLQKGGVKLSQARAIALEMSDNRNKMVELLSSRTDLDSNTCEGKADAARFNFLFSCCLVYDDTGEPYFPNNIDDYLLNQDDRVALAGATQFYYFMSGSSSVDSRLPENKFLHKFKFVNENLQLVDKDGRLINREGQHIDEDGNFVTWGKDGTATKVDQKGRPVKEDGDFDVEHSPFLDEEGDPIDESLYEIVDESVKEESDVEDDVESKPKRRRRKTTAKSAKEEKTSD